MSIKVEVTPDISTFKERAWGNMNWRQIISLSLAAVIAILLYSVFDLPQQLRRMAVILCITPILLVGFVKYQGIYFEEFLKYIFIKYWYPQKRVFRPQIDIVKEIRDMKRGSANENDRKESRRSTKKGKVKKHIQT